MLTLPRPRKPSRKSVSALRASICVRLLCPSPGRLVSSATHALSDARYDERTLPYSLLF